MKELTPKRVLRQGLLFWAGFVVLGSVVFGLSPNASWSDLYLALLLLSLLLLGILLYRKLVINFIDNRKEVRSAAAQNQALHYLFYRIKPRKAFPQMRSYAASPDFLCLLYDLIREHKPEVVLECGGGVSTLVSAYALEQNARGKVFALDHEAAYAEQTRHALKKHGLSGVGEVFHTPLTKYRIEGEEMPWYDLSCLPEQLKIDLLVVDGPPSTLHRYARFPAYPLLRSSLSPGAIILVDDCIRPAERQMVERWKAAHPDLKIEWVFTEKRAAVLTEKAL